MSPMSERGNILPIRLDISEGVCGQPFCDDTQEHVPGKKFREVDNGIGLSPKAPNMHEVFTVEGLCDGVFCKLPNMTFTAIELPSVLSGSPPCKLSCVCRLERRVEAWRSNEADGFALQWCRVGRRLCRTRSAANCRELQTSTSRVVKPILVYERRVVVSIVKSELGDSCATAVY